MNNYNKLFFSDFSPSMDHFKLNYTKNNFDYNYLLIKLNNDVITDEDLDENKYINRWMYYRDFTIKINKNTSLTFIESIISTGENRNIEWYYLTPLGLFIAEQMHNVDREDNGINDLLEEHKAPKDIDYISIDTEGSEFSILKELDFNRYNVSIFTIEHNFIEENRNKVKDLLEKNNYLRVFEKISVFDGWYIKQDNPRLNKIFK